MVEQNNKENQQDKSKSLHSIRTFKTDASEYLSKGEVSATDLFVKKQEPISYNIEDTPPRIEEKSRKPLIIALVMFGILAIGFSAYLLLKDGGATTTSNPDLIAPRPLLVSEQEIILESKNKSELKKELESLFNEQNTPGDLVYLPIKKRIDTAVHFLSAGEFLSSLEITAPAFLTNFLEDNFFFGFINLQKKHTLLIFEVEKNQYENTFAGMIRWEKTMIDDLDFIAKKENLDQIKIISFKDKIIKNQSARMVTTEKGDVLVYTFINRSYIIITDSQEALEEIVKRFTLYKFS